MANLSLYDPDALPADLMLDGSHPAADEYIKGLAHIRKVIMQASAKMHPRKVRAVKLAHIGKSHVETAKVLKVTQATVGKYVNSTDGKHLANLLSHYAMATDGPIEAQRRNMLWRIAQDNEKNAPKTSVVAIAEINRMSSAAYERLTGNVGNQPVQIIINQATLPRGTLDD